MAEFAQTLFSAGSSAVSTLASAAPSLSTVATVLQAGTSIYSAYSTVQAGKAQARTAQINAEMAALEAQREDLQGTQKEIEIKRETLKRIGQSRVAFGASGLDISSASSVEDAVSSESDFAIKIAKSNAERRAAAARAKSGMLKSQGQNALAAAKTQAFTDGAASLIQIMRRG